MKQGVILYLSDITWLWIRAIYILFPVEVISNEMNASYKTLQRHVSWLYVRYVTKLQWVCNAVCNGLRRN